MGFVCPSSDLKTCLLKLVAHFLPPSPRHTLSLSAFILSLPFWALSLSLFSP